MMLVLARRRPRDVGVQQRHVPVVHFTPAALQVRLATNAVHNLVLLRILDNRHIVHVCIQRVDNFLLLGKRECSQGRAGFDAFCRVLRAQMFVPQRKRRQRVFGCHTPF